MIENERGQWLAEIQKRDAEITRLRTELADVRAEIERRDSYRGCDGCSTGDCHHENTRFCMMSQAKVIAEQEAAHATILRECQTLIAERDTLRQQLAAEQQAATMLSLMVKERDAELAVAREGLVEIIDYKDRVQSDDWDTGWNDGRGGAAHMAGDTLAKLDQMGEKP